MIKDAGASYTFGSTTNDAQPLVTVTVHEAGMWTRILMVNDIGCEFKPLTLCPSLSISRSPVSEAYMNGDFDVSSLKDLFNVCPFTALESIFPS